jgi:hypothetical protein
VASEDDALAVLQAAEVDRRLRFPDPFRNQRCTASLDGFSLHAGVRIHEHDREGLERLCRYAVRPPFALQRLSQGEAGHLVYRMKRPRGGSLFLLLEPDELLTGAQWFLALLFGLASVPQEKGPGLALVAFSLAS